MQSSLHQNACFLRRFVFDDKVAMRLAAVNLVVLLGVMFQQVCLELLWIDAVEFAWRVAPGSNKLV